MEHAQANTSLRLHSSFGGGIEIGRNRIMMQELITRTEGGCNLHVVADVVLWRRSNVSASILVATLSAWLLFRVWGYTMLSLLSNVLLLLTCILFLWAKAARLLNRPLPPIPPKMRISQQAVNQVATLLHSGLNMLFSIFQDIATGRDSALFYQVFLFLCTLSWLGSLTDFPTFCYTIIVGVLTIPALYEKYKECVHKYARFTYMELQMYERVYERVSMKCFESLKNWIVEVLKES